MKKTINSLQILRAVALIAVYCYHQLLADEAYSRFGVCVFFILSGFLNIYRGYDRDHERGIMSSVRYGLSKIKKIYPLHIIMLAVAFVLEIISRGEQYASDVFTHLFTVIVKLVLNVFLISDWIPHIEILDKITGEYNIATWFLSCLLLFYILTPTILRVMHRIYDDELSVHGLKPYLVSVLIIVFVIIENIFFYTTLGESRSFWIIYESPFSRIGDYLVGAQLGFIYLKTDYDGIREQSGDHKAVTMGVTALAFSVYICITLIALGMRLPNNYRWIVSSGFYFTIPVSILIFSLASIDVYFDKYSESPISHALIWLGGISSYVYLIHVPVINCVHGIYKRVCEVNVLVWTVISAVVTLVLSVIYERIIWKRHT